MAQLYAKPRMQHCRTRRFRACPLRKIPAARQSLAAVVPHQCDVSFSCSVCPLASLSELCSGVAMMLIHAAAPMRHCAHATLTGEQGLNVAQPPLGWRPVPGQKQTVAVSARPAATDHMSARLEATSGSCCDCCVAIVVERAGSPRREVTRMGNKGDTGPFAPAVRFARGVIGKKEFNKLRGKAISLHSQGGRGPAAACCKSTDAAQSNQHVGLRTVPYIVVFSVSLRPLSQCAVVKVALPIAVSAMYMYKEYCHAAA